MLDELFLDLAGRSRPFVTGVVELQNLEILIVSKKDVRHVVVCRASEGAGASAAPVCHVPHTKFDTALIQDLIASIQSLFALLLPNELMQRFSHRQHAVHLQRRRLEGLMLSDSLCVAFRQHILS